MKADNAVGLAKFKYLIRLLNSIKNKKTTQIDFFEEETDVQCHFQADQESYKLLNNHIKNQGRLKLVVGLIAGFFIGIISGYFIIPSSVIYLNSSESGLIPPQYDLLFKSKKPYEQAIQILTHQTTGEDRRMGGPYRGKKMCYSAKVNDTTQIELWYQLADRSLWSNLGQTYGGEFVQNAVQEGMENSGIDSAAKYYAGNSESNVALQVSDGITRTTTMAMEQQYLSQPVIRIVIDGSDDKIEYTNFLPWDGSFSEEYSIEDSDPADVETRDNCREGRNTRVPIPRDEAQFVISLQEFVDEFIETNEVHQ